MSMATDTPMAHGIPGHVETGLPGVPLGELVRPQEVAGVGRAPVVR
jgi:hypothetical protein